MSISADIPNCDRGFRVCSPLSRKNNLDLLMANMFKMIVPYYLPSVPGFGDIIKEFSTWLE